MKLLQERLTSSSLIDLRKHNPETCEEVEAADGVIRVWRDRPPEACVKSDRFREWFKTTSQQQLVVQRLTQAGALDVNEKRGLSTRQCHLPLLKEKPSCFVIRLHEFEKLAAAKIKVSL